MEPEDGIMRFGRAVAFAALCVVLGCADNERSAQDRATLIVTAYLELCPFMNDHDDSDRVFRDAAARAQAEGHLVLSHPANDGVIANIYQGAWRGEPVVVTYVANPSMVMCGMRFKPAPVLTQVLASRLGREPRADSGDGLYEWAVSDDPLASLRYQNIGQRGIPYSGPSPVDDVGYSDNIMYIRFRRMGEPTRAQ